MTKSARFQIDNVESENVESFETNYELSEQRLLV